MRKTILLSATFGLILVIVLGTSASAQTDATSGTNAEAEQRFEKANELLKRADYGVAIAEYKKVLDLSPGSKIAQDAQYWMGQAHFRAGQFDAAQEMFAKLIQAYPTSAIVPVTKLMVERVARAKENEGRRRALSDASDKGFIIDPDTGVKYTKAATFAGKNDVIEDTTYQVRLGRLRLSPNGRFLLYGKLVIPVDGSEPFNLVDTPVYNGTWSPDGRNVAFYSGDAICVVPVSPQTGRPTGPVRKLLEGNYKSQTSVSWSPDSEKLVFQNAPDIKKGIYGGDIWTLSVKDGSLTQITSSPNREGAPAWSSDGKTIVYGMREEDRYKKGYSFWLVSAEGGIARKIFETGERRLPIWSPDGKWILCSEPYKLVDKIHFFGLDDKQEFEMIPPVEVVGDFFSWSPDGNKMLFYRPSYGYKYGIKVVSASGGPPFDLGREITLYPEHLWTPDSKMIVAEGGNEDGRYGVWISPLSGGEPVFLEMDVSVGGGPLQIIAISPNVQKLAFSVDQDDGTEDLYVVSISLQGARTKGPAVKVFDGLYRGLGTNVTASWSHDGSKLALIHRGEVWMASSNGDKPVQVTETPEMEIWPRWSPDGRMINYIAYAGGERTFYVKPVSGGEATKIPGADRTSAWSPDSKKLVIQSEGMISVVSAADGGTQQIAKLKDLGLERIFYFSWSPDGKYIACVGKHIEKGDAGPIFIIPIEGGKAATLVTNDTSYKYLLHWSPDGRWISYNSEGPVKVRPEGTLWQADFDEILEKCQGRKESAAAGRAE